MRQTRRRCKVAQSGECVEISRQSRWECVRVCVHVCVAAVCLRRARFAAQVREMRCHKKL